MGRLASHCFFRLAFRSKLKHDGQPSTKFFMEHCSGDHCKKDSAVCAVLPELSEVLVNPKSAAVIQLLERRGPKAEEEVKCLPCDNAFAIADVVGR